MGHASCVSEAVLPSAELNLGGTSTTEKVFCVAGSTTLACILPLNDMETLAGATGKRASMIKITAAGRVTGGTTTNYTPKLYFGTSITVASDLAIGTGATVAVNSVSGTWMIEWTGTIDNVSGKIDGFFSNMVSGSTRTYTAAAAATAAITSATTPALSFTTASAQGFVITGTFSGGNAANVAYVDVFQLEVVG
jgi:hypothetical protein